MKYNCIIAAKKVRFLLVSMLMLLACSASAQKEVSGKVLDESGEPIIGAVIKEINSNMGVMSHGDGSFKINVSGKKPLRISCIGYATVEVAVDNKSYIKVVMHQDNGYSKKKTQQSQSDDSEALYQKAKQLYSQGEYAEAVKWFRKAAEQGNALAQNGLGNCYYAGKGVMRDYDEAVRWYRKSAEQGNALAQYNLGACYYNGEGVTQNYDQAIKWFRKSAAQGDTDSQNYLGSCYFDGVGVTKDLDEAVRWCRKAAEQGNVWAQHNLGTCYYNGEGVAKDRKEAVKWFRKSAEQGYAGAQNYMGHCYYNGEGVAQDFKEAVKWFQKSAEQGYAWAQNNLGNCYYYGNGVKRDFKEAVKWYCKSAEQGQAEAQNSLGFCYANAEGVPYDLNEAEKWWKKAAEQGNIDAKMALNNLAEERAKGVAPPPSLSTLLTGISDISEEDSQELVDAIKKEVANAPEPEIPALTATYTTTTPPAENVVKAPKLKVLSDARVTFTDTRHTLRFAISDASHAVKYRIDGGEIVTLSSNDVAAGVCDVELPQRDCMLTMWCVGGDPHMINFIYDREASVRQSATLHILAIGLNDYQDPNLGDLNYAEQDARAVIKAIKSKHKDTFANIDAQLLVGRDVTSAQISEKINNLADKAASTDMAVIFFAGHGLVDERDRYYLSTYDLTDASTPRRGGYSASTFIEDISYINCKLLVFIDACYSGKLLEGYRGTVSSEDFFREMNKTTNGTCIYTSSNKDVKSKESSRFGHGVFTQALIESFEFENSDVDMNNRISVTEVRNYLERRIPELTGNKQRPIYRNVEEIDFPLFIK